MDLMWEDAASQPAMPSSRTAIRERSSDIDASRISIDIRVDSMSIFSCPANLRANSSSEAVAVAVSCRFGTLTMGLCDCDLKIRSWRVFERRSLDCVHASNDWRRVASSPSSACCFLLVFLRSPLSVASHRLIYEI